MGYYNNVNPDLLALIPPDAKTVLEIGCGEGALCEAYRRVNPGVRWFGIENNQKAAEVAEQNGLSIIGSDAECWSWEVDNSLPVHADCLVLGDVLEHLRDPWRTLKTFADLWLKPGAQVLACIPNVQHWTVIRDLMAGKWEYTDSGLLDRTHLRFFTLDSIRKMFDQAGLQVFEIIGRDICNQDYEWFYKAMEQPSYGGCSEMGESVLEYLDIDPIEFAKRTKAYQYVVRAIKPINEMTIEDCEAGQEKRTHQLAIRGIFGPKPIPKLHIHAVTAEGCCARPRILEPFAMLRTMPGVKCSTSTDRAPQNFPSDVLIMQRPRTYSKHFYQCMRETGRIVVVEVDDLPEAIDVNPMALKAVHAIQCSTEALAEVCRQYNPNVMVFENQIAELPPWHDREPREQVHIFFGAQNRQEDWAPIMPALNRIIKEHHSKLWFSVVHDRAFYDALDTMQKSFAPFCEYSRYRELLRACDIALLPLEDTPFNRCKSDIKFLECAAEGVVPLCSPTVYLRAFNKATAKGSISTIYHDLNDFSFKLGQLIDSAKTRRSNAENAYAYVRDNRLLSQHYRKRYEWYQSLLSSKPILDRQLVERVPELSGHLAPA